MQECIAFVVLRSGLVIFFHWKKLALCVILSWNAIFGQDLQPEQKNRRIASQKKNAFQKKEESKKKKKKRRINAKIYLNLEKIASYVDILCKRAEFSHYFPFICVFFFIF